MLWLIVKDKNHNAACLNMLQKEDLIWHSQTQCISFGKKNLHVLSKRKELKLLRKIQHCNYIIIVNFQKVFL